MRFMMLMIPRVYQAGEAAKGPPPMPDAEGIAAMMKFNKELQDAGALIALDGLHPPAAGGRVEYRGGKAFVSDMPLPEAKEVIGGYWIIRTASVEEAMDWARRCPAFDGDVIEVRRIQEMEDFSEESIGPSRELAQSISEKLTSGS
jgi:hypothetical protein